MGEKHFKGKEAVEHVAEMQAKGMIDRQEDHSVELPGHIFSGLDSLKEVAVVLSLLSVLPPPFSLNWQSLLFIGGGLLLWRTFRSCWIGWARLERLHHLIKQEKWEIDHHRPQEKEELKALYRAKGFEGKLLDDVIDVLMADSDRLLKVMIEEELGLTLEVQPHPLQQGLSASIGSVFALLAISASYFLFSSFGALLTSYALIAAAAFFTAIYENRKWIPEMVWNLGALISSQCLVYYLFGYVLYA